VGAPSWDEVGVEKLLGEVAISRQQPDHAVAIAEIALRRRLSPRARARMSNLLGIALATLGRGERAAAAFRSELQAARQLGDDVLLAHAHGNSAEIAFRLGDHQQAARHQRACLRLATALGQTGMVAYTLFITARMAGRVDPAEQSDWEVAVRLTAKAEALLEETGLALYPTDRQIAEQLHAAARARLGAARCSAAHLAGRALDLDAAIAIADGVLERHAAGGRSRIPARPI
jgi:tetratricopeptide (TPR) repeat protein